MDKQGSTHSRLNFYLALYLFLTLGYIFSFGFFTPSSALVLLIIFIVWSTFLFKKNLFKNFAESPQLLLYSVLIISVILSLVLLDPTLRQQEVLSRPQNFIGIALSMHIILTVNLFLSVFLPYLKNYKAPFFTLFICAALLRILIIVASPNPRIDVFDMLKIGPSALVEGKNPYQIDYIPIYSGVKPDYFSYGPGILLLEVPFIKTFADPRYLMIVSEIATAFVLYKLNRRQLFLPLIYLFNPVSLFIISRSWIDPMAVFSVSLLALLVTRMGWSRASYFLLAITATIKQDLVLLPLFFLKSLKNRGRAILWTILAFSVVVVPFFVWSPKDFIADTIVWHIKYPVRHDGLTFNSLIYFFTNKDVPTIFFMPIWLITGIIVYKKQSQNFAENFSLMAYWFFSFFFFNKLAFVHYYYFIGSVILIYLTLVKNQPKSR